MDFYQMAGKMAVGSRLRKLSDILTENAAKVYDVYQVDLEPRWFPVFYTLAKTEGLGVMEIAQSIGQSHASVSQIIKKMKKKGLIAEVKDEADGRRSVVELSAKGKEVSEKLEQQMIDVKSASEELLSEMQYDMWKSIEEMEFLLEQRSLFDRVMAKRKEREVQKVKIVDYHAKYQNDFKRLNIEWIEAFFKVEKTDLLYLDNPKSYIIDKGGHIFFAEYDGEIVGTCALAKMDDETFELAKMGVSPKAQGKKIGWLLGQACIDKAKALGTKRIFLESNTRLVPAINLYHKLGFQKVTGPPSPYERANIQMELIL
ncbi:GNAT family N-acetyltransferase [uncultured Imperialibacter sp.]|uniref:bifunctional helix-turn-helix transcriptional regulator/GNAT family N-acetyltransferase n=1 Tax=uncultured Imperialibacter sp. TaxID=1672639 RepID=UPI0030DA017C|tara:strand:+ start:6586 stop:7530 length:945 start_codon:yes stop_codon:yes gene_type:complete